jgi:hypothetical protein
MTRYFHLCFALLAASLALAARAQQAPTAVADEGTPQKTVTVAARKNAGDLPYYENFMREQARVYNSLPPRPRMIDFLWRISFAELTEPERDAYVPKDWAVALVGTGYEQTVQVARGGYFLLPSLPVGRWGATIMIRDQSKPGKLGVAWVVHMNAGQHLSYADFARALDEVHAAQNAMPLASPAHSEVRNAKYDGLKACFLDASGGVFVDGKPSADATVGTCTILKFDPARAGSGQTIEFRGPLQIVTVVNATAYLQPRN